MVVRNVIIDVLWWFLFLKILCMFVLIVLISVSFVRIVMNVFGSVKNSVMIVFVKSLLIR